MSNRVKLERTLKKEYLKEYIWIFNKNLGSSGVEIHEMTELSQQYTYQYAKGNRKKMISSGKPYDGKLSRTVWKRILN